MSDSPKCLNCLKNGMIGQTYRMAGSANFHCHDCHRVYRMTDFDPIEFEWQSNPSGWRDFVKTKGVSINV